MVHADRIAATLRCTETGANQSDAEAGASSSANLVIPFIPRLLPRKGIAHAPVEHGTIDPRTQDTLLQAIARSRSWTDAILAGKTAFKASHPRCAATDVSCCSINNDLMDAVFKVLHREFPVDYLIVETTGLADPLPVV